MSYAAEARKVRVWLDERGITAPRVETVSPPRVMNHMRPYRTILDRRVFADLRTLNDCAVYSDGPQYLPLSPKLGEDFGNGYSLSSKENDNNGQGDSAFGQQWIIIYGGNICRLQLFAIADIDTRLGGVEIQIQEGDGKSQRDFIAQMRTIHETNTAMVQIQFALASWILRIHHLAILG